VAKLGVPRLRFLTSYPSQFTDEMIEVMAQYPTSSLASFPRSIRQHLCLKRMGRRYTREEYLALVKSYAEAMPFARLHDRHHRRLPRRNGRRIRRYLSFAKKSGYSAAFTLFIRRAWGPRPPAMVQVPDEVKHERFDRLKAVIEKTTSEHSRKRWWGNL
jgi:tRNA-2-methylthio-N6-dimethylallyladenosine synthase